jgi:hypothetical protein
VNNFGGRTDQDPRTTNKSVDAAKKGVKIIANEDLDSFFV